MLWNSTYICGIGIGIAAQSWEEWMMLAAAGGLLALAVRTVVMKRQWSFANRYLFREGVLSKDTSYRGKRFSRESTDQKRFFTMNSRKIH